MHSHISNKIDLLVQKPLKIAKEWLDQHPSKEIVFFLSYYLCKFSEWDPPFGASMRREKDSLYKGKRFYQKRESEVKKICKHTLFLFLHKRWKILTRFFWKKQWWKNMKLHLKIRKNKIKQLTLAYLKETFSWKK